MKKNNKARLKWKKIKQIVLNFIALKESQNLQNFDKSLIFFYFSKKFDISSGMEITGLQSIDRNLVNSYMLKKFENKLLHENLKITSKQVEKYMFIKFSLGEQRFEEIIVRNFLFRENTQFAKQIERHCLKYKNRQKFIQSDQKKSNEKINNMTMDSTLLQSNVNLNQVLQSLAESYGKLTFTEPATENQGKNEYNSDKISIKKSQLSTLNAQNSNFSGIQLLGRKFSSQNFQKNKNFLRKTEPNDININADSEYLWHNSSFKLPPLQLNQYKQQQNTDMNSSENQFSLFKRNKQNNQSKISINSINKDYGHQFSPYNIMFSENQQQKEEEKDRQLNLKEFEGDEFNITDQYQLENSVSHIQQYQDKYQGNFKQNISMDCSIQTLFDNNLNTIQPFIGNDTISTEQNQILNE
ncbi:hypothetical protein PPERSA_08451 [Pseudocohnilembus persalinus]|uniref:Uncharacterized protein n=1 Tax=Pseudocohnilembus persalinus TaxID=266149 RepID=A0A0V0R6R3_PSEPJ|nr:hypothetical protein PPERSA_08451 [Pseudocohnilembus persalinus]|eukprot:KRX10048.1 hypothetical protein PPERSA_08451 [Pseudocohnilembus persalinus]